MIQFDLIFVQIGLVHSTTNQPRPAPLVVQPTHGSNRGILQEMQAANCKPDVISYNSALGALDRAGKGKEERVTWRRFGESVWVEGLVP